MVRWALAGLVRIAPFRRVARTVDRRPGETRSSPGSISGISRNANCGPGIWPGAGVCEGPTTRAMPGPLITSCGGFAPSREDRARAVLLVVDVPKLIKPLPVTADVTLTLVHEPAATAPELPSFAPNGGAFESVIVVSPQVVSATLNAS